MAGDSFALSSDDLSRLVFTDDLTGLNNRRYLRHWLQQSVAWEDPAAPPLSLLMLDLDNFKVVNDTQGHLAGDRLLMQVAGLLSECVGSAGTVVRYAGDEFVLILPGASREMARDVAERVRLAMERVDAGEGMPGQRIAISSSIGIAVFPDDARVPDTLLERADLAMYQAKQTGKNRIADGGDLSAGSLSEHSLLEAFPCPHLVGRAADLARVFELADRCRSGGIGLVVVRGRPGLGKTRLLGEIVKAAGGNACVPLLVRCTAEERRFPFATILHLLERFMAKYPQETEALRKRLPDDEVAVLARFFPGLVCGASGEDHSLAAAVEGLTSEHRALLFNGLLRCIVRLSDQALPLLMLDDAENIDEATLDILSRVVREGGGRLLVCVAVRLNEQGRAGHDALDAFLGAVGKLPETRALDLTPLDPANVRDMLDHLLPGREPNRELEALISQVTGGNPLFVEESVKSLVLKRKIHREAGAWRYERITRADLPPTLHEVIRGQMEGFDPLSRQLIARAAVIGPNFALDLLQGIAGSNQGETLDVMDKARKARLLLPAGPDADQEMRFAAHHLREVTYTNADAQFRRQVHREIGRFEEKRSQDCLEDKASYLLYHFEQGGDQERATRYRELVERMGRAVYVPEELKKESPPADMIPEIAEATAPLPEEATPALLAFLRNLPAAVKTVRMYPPGSLLIRGAIEGIDKSLRDLFRWAPAVTLATEQEHLLVCTRPADTLGAGAVAVELARSLEARSLASVTFTSASDVAELTQFFHELGRVPEVGGYAAGYWQARARELRLRGIGVVQQAYVVQRPAEGGADEAPILAEVAEPLASDLVPAVREAVRHLTGSIENLVMYPPGSRLIHAAVDQLASSLQPMLGSAKMVLFAEVGGKLVVNGTEAHGAAYGQAPAVLLRRLGARGITTLGFREGIGTEELTRFLSALVREDLGLQGHKAWEAWLAREGLTHVAIGDRVYSVARRATRPTDQEPTPTPASEVMLPVLEQLKRHLDAGADDPKPPALAASFLAHLEKLHLGADRAGTETAVSILKDKARADRLEIRRRTWAFTLLVTEKPSPTIAPALAECLLFPVENALDVETDEESLLRALTVAGRCMGVFVSHGSYVLANRLLWGAFRRAQSGGSRAITQGAGQTVERAASFPELPILAETASSEAEGPEAARAAACREYLLALGTRAVIPVLNTIRRTEALSPRRILARVMKDLGPQGEKEILKEISPFGNPRELARLYEVLEIFNIDAAPLVIAGFKHKEDAVKRSAIDLLRRLARDRVRPVLARAVEDEDPEVLKAAVTAIGDLRPEEGIAWIRSILKGGAPSDVQQACCIALGKFEDETVVPLLAGILEGGGFLGLFGRKDDDVRASAAWSLGHFKSPAAREALTRALKDPNPGVRSSAKMGLKG